MIYSCGKFCFVTYALVIDLEYDEVTKLSITQPYHKMETVKQILKFHNLHLQDHS